MCSDLENKPNSKIWSYSPNSIRIKWNWGTIHSGRIYSPYLKIPFKIQPKIPPFYALLHYSIISYLAKPQITKYCSTAAYSSLAWTLLITPKNLIRNQSILSFKLLWNLLNLSIKVWDFLLMIKRHAEMIWHSVLRPLKI